MLLRQDVSASIVAVICDYFKFTIQAPGAPGDNHVDKLPKGNLFQMIWHKDIPKSKYLLMKFFHMCGRSLIAFLIIKCSKDL